VTPHGAPMRMLRPESWPRAVGYSDGVSARGRLVCIAGQTGWNPLTQEFETDDLAEQTAQALSNVAAVLRAAGAEPGHLVRLVWYVLDRTEYNAAREPIGRHYRRIIGEHYPAMSLLIVAGLHEERARVEIEATAVIPLET
jgi:enamine deaminase RidA (YjgF/YER057c/UK114 family)